MRPERAGFCCMLGGPGSRRQHHLRGVTRRRSSRPSSTAGPLSRRGRPAIVGGQVSAGSKQVRRHNRERGPYPPTASPSDGSGVGRFWPPAIDLRMRGTSPSKKPCFLVENGQGGGSPMCISQKTLNPFPTPEIPRCGGRRPRSRPSALAGQGGVARRRAPLRSCAEL